MGERAVYYPESKAAEGPLITLVVCQAVLADFDGRPMTAAHIADDCKLQRDTVKR